MSGYGVGARFLKSPGYTDRDSRVIGVQGMFRDKHRSKMLVVQLFFDDNTNTMATAS